MIRVKIIMLLVCLPSWLMSQASIYAYKAYKMGTEFNIKVHGEDTVRITQAVQLAWDRIDALNQVFSDYSTTSELARLHRDSTGRPFRLSQDFYRLMDISIKYSHISRGAFDVSVGALSKIWRRAIKLNDYPDSLKIKAALKHVGYKKIRLIKNKIKIPGGMVLDFGAIAKGYAVDEAYKVLAQQGYTMSLVDGGGDIYVGVSPPNQSGWAITASIKRDHLWRDTMIYVESASIVTSGDAYKFVEDKDGLRHSHIIDPKTGFGIPGPHLTIVIAANATHADALATTLSVMESSELKRFQKKWTKTFPHLPNTWSYKIFSPTWNN